MLDFQIISIFSAIQHGNWLGKLMDFTFPENFNSPYIFFPFFPKKKFIKLNFGEDGTLTIAPGTAVLFYTSIRWKSS